MAWTSMHFAAGMCGAGVISGITCLVIRRGYRWIPLTMTVGGLWALLPDLPRVFREDFPSLPFASSLGSRNLENFLHSYGNVFFLHGNLDAQPREFALLGLAIIIALYVAGSIMLMVMESRQRNSIGNRAWRAQRRHSRGRRASRRQHGSRDPDPPAIAGRIRSSHLSGST